MSATDLATALRAAGLDVREVHGWATRGGTWRHDQPVGLMQHHTAPPVPFPVDNLSGVSDQGRIKCNMNVKPDGTVWLIAYRAPNYSSGSGSSIVRDECIAGTPPDANAKDRGLEDDISGNPYFWGIENDHPGDGSPLPSVQAEAIALASVIVAGHFDLDWRNVISHAEWSHRKHDPYWNQDYRAIDQIRSDMQTLGKDEGPNGEPNWSQVADWARPSWSKAWANNILKPESHPRDMVDKQELMVFFDRTGLLDVQ